MHAMTIGTARGALVARLVFLAVRLVMLLVTGERLVDIGPGVHDPGHLGGHEHRERPHDESPDQPATAHAAERDRTRDDTAIVEQSRGCAGGHCFQVG